MNDLTGAEPSFLGDDRPERKLRRIAMYACLGLICCACTGTIEPSGQNGHAGAADPTASDDEPGSAAPGSSPRAAAGSQPIDVNRIGIHRLNNTEYDNTVRDLLGVGETPARSFIADEKALGFDNIAEALGMTDAQYEQYWNAADSLSEQVFADATLRARILTCTPAAAVDETCTRSIVAAFGKRAWRRPLADAEIDRLVQLAGEASMLGEDFAGSIKHVAKALLLSVPFLYRVELDSDPEAATPHALDAYELASRLSYLVWSTMPDATLIQAADSGELLDTDVLAAQLRRMLADARGERFVRGFAGQWLGMRDLESHQVEPTAFPEWSTDLRDAMIAEGYQYFSQFVQGRRSLQEFFTADVNFVDDRLAALYDFSGQSFDPSTAFHDTTDARRGFLGLASFLTLTSYSYRTAPTLRGKWVLQNLLCQDIPPPPPNVPKLDDSQADSAATQSLNVRDRLAEHRKNPQCASCHVTLDPIGLGLENFDAIGQYRTQYANGDAIDASGTLPSGESFDGLHELSDLLAGDARLADCASEKLLTYALSRRIVPADQPYLQALRTQWRDDGMSIAALLERIVVSEPFRSRRGEAAP
jgi:hypothetical protein